MDRRAVKESFRSLDAVMFSYRPVCHIPTDCRSLSRQRIRRSCSPVRTWKTDAHQAEPTDEIYAASEGEGNYPFVDTPLHFTPPTPSLSQHSHKQRHAHTHATSVHLSAAFRAYLATHYISLTLKSFNHLTKIVMITYKCLLLF